MDNVGTYHHCTIMEANFPDEKIYSIYHPGLEHSIRIAYSSLEDAIFISKLLDVYYYISNWFPTISEIFEDKIK